MLKLKFKKVKEVEIEDHFSLIEIRDLILGGSSISNVRNYLGGRNFFKTGNVTIIIRYFSDNEEITVSCKRWTMAITDHTTDKEIELFEEVVKEMDK